MSTHDVAAALAKLPPHCFATTPDGKPIMIKRGKAGYQPVESDLPPGVLNAQLDPPPKLDQVEAMTVGSMIGGDVPGANPDVVRARRKLDEDAP